MKDELHKLLKLNYYLKTRHTRIKPSKKFFKKLQNVAKGMIKVKEKISETRFKATFDRMIDNQTRYDNYSPISRIIKSHFLRLGTRSAHSECILLGNNNCNDIINAHSIQNNGVLSKLAEEGKVIQIEDHIIDITNRRELLKGRNEATTFRGFCKVHDEIFNPIETKEYEYGNLQQNYLFAYRAFAKSYTNNLTSKNFYDEWIEKLVNNSSLEKVLEKQVNSNLGEKEERELKKKIVLERQKQRDKQLQQLGAEFEELKIAMNTNLHKRRYHKLETVVIELNIKNTIACSSLIYIYSDLNGYPFNPKLKLPSFITIFPHHDVTLVLLSFFKKHKTNFEVLINQITSASEAQQEMIISNLLLKYGDNIILSPSQFDKFNKKALNILEKGINSRTQLPGEKLIYYPINLFRPKSIN